MKRRRKIKKTLAVNTCSVNVREVPVAVRDLFKAYCASHGYTMQRAIVCLMKDAQKKDRVIPGIEDELE